MTRTHKATTYSDAHNHTNLLHAAFWGTQPLTGNPEPFTPLPTRRYDMMKQEIKELRDMDMCKLGKGEMVGRVKR